MLKKSSVSVAKSRLKLLIVSDRISCSPVEYENISRDLFQTLSKYLELTEDNFHVEIYRTHIFISYGNFSCTLCISYPPWHIA